MKKGTKITVFIASMALTIGCLVALVGPRHCGNQGIYKHSSCKQMNTNSTSSETNQAF